MLVHMVIGRNVAAPTARPLRIGMLLGLSPHTLVGKPQPGERGPVESVPAVDDDRPGHDLPRGGPIKFEELLPFGHQDACIGALEG